MSKDKSKDKVYKFNAEFESVLKKEGMTGKQADTARAIFVQESGGGSNTKTSNHGAIGGMQIKSKTFSEVADKGWNIHNPIHNMQAGVRYVKQLFNKTGGDQDLTAIGYYGGPGAIEAAKKGIDWKDRKNPNNPTVFQYRDQVKAIVNRLSGSSAHADEIKSIPTTKGVSGKGAPDVVSQARQLLKDHPELSKAKPHSVTPSAVRPHIKETPQTAVKEIKKADPNGMMVDKKTPTQESNLFGFKGPVKDPVFNTFSAYDNLSRYGKVKINEETKPVVSPKALAKSETEAPVKKIYDAPGSITGEKDIKVDPLNRAEGKNEIAARAKFKDSVLGLEKDKQAELRGEGKQIPKVIKETPVKSGIPQATVKDIPKSKPVEVTAPKLSTPVAKIVETVATNVPVTDAKQVNEFTEKLQPVKAEPVSTAPVQSIPTKVVEPVVNDYGLDDDEIPEPAKVSKPAVVEAVRPNNDGIEPITTTNPVDTVYTPDNQKFANRNSLLNGSVGNPGANERAVFPETFKTQEDYFKEAMGLKPVLGTEPLSTIQQPVLQQPVTNPVDTNYFPGSEGFANKTNILPGSLGRPGAIERILAPNTMMPIQDDYTSIEKYNDRPMFENNVYPTNNSNASNIITPGLSSDMTPAEFAANHKQVQDWAYKDEPQAVAGTVGEYVPQAETVARPDINIPADNIAGLTGSFKNSDVFQGSLNRPASTEQSLFPSTSMPLEDNYKEVQGVAPALSQRTFTQTPNTNSYPKMDIDIPVDHLSQTNDEVLGGISVRAKRDSLDPYQQFAEVHQRVAKPVQASDLNYLQAMKNLGSVQVPDFMSAIGRMNPVPVVQNTMTPQSNDMRNLLMHQMRRS